MIVKILNGIENINKDQEGELEYIEEGIKEREMILRRQKIKKIKRE